MKNLIILLVALLLMGFSDMKVGETFSGITATIYHAVPGQTDSTPFITASLKRINKANPEGHRWIAVSRDLEQYGFVFGAKVCVEDAGELNGIWTVEDRMNKRWKNRIDFLVNTTRRGGKWKDVKITLIKEL
jgi:3D (Asp-Asp-Asp) domain-containing protein